MGFAVICILIILKKRLGLVRVAAVTKIRGYMFPQFKRINNESGVVLFIVLMTAIIIMIYSLGVLTQSLNEINYAQQQIDQINCDQLKKGFLWSSYASNSMQNVGISTVIGGRTYTITPVSTVNASGGNTWQISCTYDTFQ